MDLVKNKLEKLDLGLTGRYAAQELIELSDLVTEMREVNILFQKTFQLGQDSNIKNTDKMK